MSDCDYDGDAQSPIKAYKECTMLMKCQSQGRKKENTDLSEYIDLHKKKQNQPRRYDVSEMICNNKSNHEVLESDEHKISEIDHCMALLEPALINKVCFFLKNQYANFS